MQKYKFIALILLSMILSVFLYGCATAEDVSKFKDTARSCVENDNELLLELYDIFTKDEIVGISSLDDEDDLEKGIAFEYNHNGYYIRTSEKNEANLLLEDYQRACEIADYLMNEYLIDNIVYYSSFYYMQYQFNENRFDMDWNIEYYPSNIDAPRSYKQLEYYEEIMNGFYIYIFYPGF